jgi:hypothetical protein
VPLEPGPRAVQLAGDALADRDHEVLAEEDADLTGVDLLALVVVARGAQHGQLDPALVALHLGPQVEGLGVLDGQGVQMEVVPYPVELLGRGFEEAEPDEAFPGTSAGGLVQRDGALVLPVPVAVVRAVNDHCCLRCAPRRTR